MTALTWDQIGERRFETGISKGVLYGSDGLGVAWNGLVAIGENTGSSVESVHFDGVKYDDIITMGDFSATLRAFTYPDEFLQYEGLLQDATGFYVSGQPPSQFSLSYQTLIGSDTEGTEAGVKIHVLYNLTAIPSQRSNQTLSMETEPLEFEWSLTSIPEEIEGFRPSAHAIFDSRQIDPYLFQDLQDILYGTEEDDARLPSLKGLAAFMRKWGRLVITDLGNGLWEAYSPLDDVIVMLDATTFQIDSDTAIFLDPETYEISSSEKIEEDL